MTPHSGFYGLFDRSGRVRREQFPALGFPQPQQASGPFWSTAWSADGNKGISHSEGIHDLIFLGELYNAPALRRQLDTPDDFSLGQLLLLAFKRWSTDYVLHLDGQFVLALRHSDQLHLYRDGSGAQNLYYAPRQDGRIAFATQLDTLFRLPGMEKRLAHPSLHEYLRLLEIAAPNTIYEGVSALEAGHLLGWAVHEHSSRRPTADKGAHPAPSFAEALDTLDDLLQHSVEQRLQNASRPAAFLSGGVDSSLLCALASRSHPDLTAVTVGFDHARLDETPIAQQIAQHLGIRHQVLRFTRQDSLQAFEAFARNAEQPMGDPAIPPTLLAFEHGKSHFDAVLDGSGADESCGAMPPRHVRIGVEYAARLPATMRRAVAGAMRHLPGLASYTPILDFEHPAELMLRWHGFPQAEIEALCGEPVSFEHTQFYRTFARFPRPAHFERYSALLDALTSDRLHHAAAITGLAVRYPYLDRAVDSFIRALPVEYRYQPTEPKRLLRALLARHVPRNLWDTPKHGFDFPLQEFLCAEDFQLVRRYLLNGHWAQWQLLSPGRVSEYGRRFIAGDQSLMFRVWALVGLSAWLEWHFD